MKHLDCLIPWSEAGEVSYRLNKTFSTQDFVAPLQQHFVIIMLNWSAGQGAEMLRGWGRKGEIKCFSLLAVSPFIEKCFSCPLLVTTVFEVCVLILLTVNAACPLADRVETLSCNGPKVVKDEGRGFGKAL